MNKIILDLCGGTGAWSESYKKAGYDVRIVDPNNGGVDVRLFKIPSESIHGILAAPPCTFFCRARMCRGRPTDEQFKEGLIVVDACLRIITVTQPKWWVLENPQGYLKNWLGEPALKFDPCHYGDPWTKRTWLWGNFIHPAQNVVKPIGNWVNSRTSSPLGNSGIAKNKIERSITPPGFAKAFFEANP